MSVKRNPYLVGKAFRSFLFASVLTAGASTMGSFIDGMMLSHFISDSAMSAINITSPVTQVLFSLCILFGTGGAMLAGMAIGNHEQGRASEIFSSVMAVSVVTGIVLGAAGLVFLKPLVGLLCPDTALQAYTADYLAVILPGAVLYMLMVPMQMFVTLDGEPKRVTAAVALSMVVNLSLDYVFIVPCGWSMTGAAVATVLSYLAALCVLVPHFFKPASLKFGMPRELPLMAEIFRMGLPFGIATALIAVQLLGNNLLAMEYLGGPGIVVLSICAYLLLLSMIIMTGTLESFQPVSAILKGSGDNHGVVLVLGRAYRFLCISLLVFSALIVMFPGTVGDLFGVDSPATMSMLHEALPAYAANIVLHCAIYLLLPVYQLYGNKKISLLISVGQPIMPVLGYWLLLAVYSSDGGMAVNPWWGFAVGQIVILICLFVFAGMKKRGHYPLILIPEDNPKEVFDVSVTPDFEAMHEAIIGIDRWLAAGGVPESLRLRVELACEESLKNIIQHASLQSAASVIDLRLALHADKIQAVIRDEGKPFNPIENDPDTGLGLLMVRKTCDSQSYEYIFHQNLLTVEWESGDR